MTETAQPVGEAPPASQDPPVSQETFAQHFREQMQGKLPDEIVDPAVEAMTAETTTSYGAVAGFINAVFYIHAGITIDPDNKANPKFSGDAGGFFWPPGPISGGGGWVITSDHNQLCRNTKSFEIHLVVGTYLGMTFFDSNSKCLGTYQGATIPAGFPTGIGGGSGSWSGCS